MCDGARPWGNQVARPASQTNATKSGHTSHVHNRRHLCHRDAHAAVCLHSAAVHNCWAGQSVQYGLSDMPTLPATRPHGHALQYQLAHQAASVTNNQHINKELSEKVVYWRHIRSANKRPLCAMMMLTVTTIFARYRVCLNILLVHVYVSLWAQVPSFSQRIEVWKIQQNQLHGTHRL